MNILACVDVGERQVVRSWELMESGDYLIVSRFERGETIAIRLDKSRVHVNPSSLKQKIANSPNQEHLEAAIASAEITYLGRLSISDAVLIQSI